MDNQNDLKSFYANKPDPGLTNRSGEIEYGEMIGAGLEHLELPAPPWEEDRGKINETMHAKHFPVHVSRRVEQAIKDQGFYGATPGAVLSWYAGVAEGLELTDSRTTARFNELSSEMAQADNQAAFFEEQVRPFLGGLRAKAR